MHGLFEPVFPLTTNKYPCQSVSVYLVCLSAAFHVFLMCVVDTCHNPNQLYDNPWYFLLLAFVRNDTFYISPILSFTLC